MPADVSSSVSVVTAAACDALEVQLAREIRQLDPLLEPFNGETCLRLCWLQITVMAEHCLVPTGQPCPDHQACRRLAFALWLRCSGRLSESDRPKTNLKGEPSCSVSN